MARRPIETTHHYDRPRRPLPVRWFNAAGRAFAGRAGPLELDVESLIASARSSTGLEDFGDDYWQPPLRVLVDSLNREARLTPLGVLIQRGRLVSALSTRLRVRALCESHPEILDIPLGPVIVIAGLQRTGTTLLHRLLASDPDMRSLQAWEALSPLPLPREQQGKPTARVRQAWLAVKGVSYLAPEFFAIHPVEHDAPEEDVLLLDLSFMSQAPEATFRVPSYAAWLEGQDSTPAYQYLRKLMKILLWQKPGKSWVLKSPHHMEYIDTLLDVFPEARILETHRDPRKTMPSFCSMVAHGRGIFSDEVDAREVADHWVRKCRRLMQRSIEARAGRDSKLFLDISYYDLLEDPLAQLDKIYAFAGLERSLTAKQEAIRMQKRNVKNKYGRHRYRLEDFGLSNEILDQEFCFYRERYAIPFEDELPGGPA